jgi:hypothetical protein
VIAAEQLPTFRAAARVLAPVLATYHAALVEAGFTRDEALTLTAALQTAMIGARAPRTRRSAEPAP